MSREKDIQYDTKKVSESSTNYEDDSNMNTGDGYASW